MKFCVPLKRLLAPGLLAAVLLTSAQPLHGLQINRESLDRLKRETITTLDMIQRFHYQQKRVEQLDSKELIDAYIKDLDGAHLFFLASDVEFAQTRFSDSLLRVYLTKGDLFPAFKIYETYEQRVRERLAWVRTRLETPLNLESDQEYVTDRSEATYPTDAADADALWERRLTFEVVTEMLDDLDYDAAVAKVLKRYERFEKQLNEVDVASVQETFLTALASLYDPHSNFFSWDSSQEFNIAISNSLIGIGAQLRQVEEECVIERLIPGGPAEMSGDLHPGDRIVAVAQDKKEPVDVLGMKLRDIVKMIRGEEGTAVHLTIEPSNGTARKVITLRRDKVELTANLASAEINEVPLGDDQLVPIGVIRLQSFYGEGMFDEASTSTSRDVKELITKLEARGIQGLVLDLRDNGGGRLEEAVALAGLFIPTGPVVQKRNYDGAVDTDWDHDPSVAYSGPLVVLTSKQSASASEIVAGALQAYNRALIVGDSTTHGKGTVQAPIDLSNVIRVPASAGKSEFGTIKITIQKFYLPNGASTQNKGVISDIVLPSATEFLLDGEAELDHALAWDTIPPVNFQLGAKDEATGSFLTSDLIETLSARSQLRQQTLPEFQFWHRSLEWLRDKNEQKTVSLNLDSRRTQKERDEATQDEFDRERLEFRKARYVMQEVDLDLTEQKEAEHRAKLLSIPLPDGRSRANQFYQKVFYYAPTADNIREVWVEYLDYERGLDHTEELAQTLTEAAGKEIGVEQVRTLLGSLKQRDRNQDFNVPETFQKVLGEGFTEAEIDAILPKFFLAMIQYDPHVLEDRPDLDVELRESMRILTDWIALSKDGAKAPFETMTASGHEAEPASKLEM